MAINRFSLDAGMNIIAVFLDNLHAGYGGFISEAL
jgi:hypothetical protein